MIYEYLQILFGLWTTLIFYSFLSPRLRHPESHKKGSQKNEIQKQIYPYFGLAPKHIYLKGIFQNMSTELMEKSYFSRLTLSPSFLANKSRPR